MTLLKQDIQTLTSCVHIILFRFHHDPVQIMSIPTTKGRTRFDSIPKLIVDINTESLGTSRELNAALMWCHSTDLVFAS